MVIVYQLDDNIRLVYFICDEELYLIYELIVTTKTKTICHHRVVRT